MTSIAGYFDTFFDASSVSFTTGPNGKPTHWKQTVFYLPEKMKVKSGEEIKGQIEVKRSKRDVRGLEVNLELNGVKYFYTVE